MPLVRISLAAHRDAAFRRAAADAVHRALVGAIGVPEGDRFQIIARSEEVIYDPSFLGVERGEGFMVVEIHLTFGRTVELKKALFAAIARELEASCGVRPQDVFVNLVEMARENWSFGNGIAQYADAPPPHLAGAGAR